MFSDETLDIIRDLMLLFDPSNLFHPGKVLPMGKGGMEVRGPALAAG